MTERIITREQYDSAACDNGFNSLPTVSSVVVEELRNLLKKPHSVLSINGVYEVVTVDEIQSAIDRLEGK